MKCVNCSKENNDNAKFCRNCGTPLQNVGFKTCINGHNFNASLTDCPFCPSIDYEKTVRESDNQKTVLDNSQATVKEPISDNDKTKIDNLGPTIKKSTFQTDTDKTVLISTSAEILPSRKLVGWLVTFDLNPNGVDFKLYEGRNVIGRSSKSDISINDRSVSDKHCTVLYRNDKFLISDELSTNGTYLNNELVEDKAYLNDNDIIKIGNINLKLKVL